MKKQMHITLNAMEAFAAAEAHRSFSKRTNPSLTAPRAVMTTAMTQKTARLNGVVEV